MSLKNQVPESPGAYKLANNDIVIYVGSTSNLRDRYNFWRNSPNNPCIIETGWTNLIWKSTKTVKEAKELERQSYYQFNPKCNEIIPPGA